MLAHPGGSAAGVSSLRAAWNATLSGHSLEDAALDDVDLRDALAAFGGRWVAPCVRRRSR